MRNILRYLLTAVAVLALLCVCVSATVTKTGVTENGLYYEIYDNSYASITGYSVEPIGELIIPKTIEGYDVTSIGYRAFRYCSSLTSVSIPDSVTSIGEEAFKYCSRLTSVSIPDSVTSIGYCAFEVCSGLTSVSIPDSVTFIGSNAFSGCTGLKTAGPIGSGCNYEYGWTETIPQCAFYNCSGLTSVSIPDSVTSIGGYAFSGCSGLTSVSIPDRVTSIGSYAFSGCSGLTSVSIPDSVTSIGGYAFSGCIGLKTAGPFGSGCNIEYGWTEAIPGYAFSGFSGLTSVSIPDSVTSIDYYAFYGCSGLTSVSIPNSVTYIGEGAFYGCSGLTSVSIPDSVTYIGHYAFRGCSGLTSVSIPDSVTYIGNCAFYGCSGLTSVSIPDSVTYIGNCAFYGCSGLTSVSIPDSVTYIYDEAFSGCTGLQTAGPIGSGCNIEYGWTNSIPESAFQSFNKLTSVIVGDSITYIDLYAFNGCTNLKTVEIGDNVTYIGYDAFRECSNLTTVNIPDSVKYIDSYAFYNCAKLEALTLPESVQYIGEYAFHGCRALTSLSIPDSVTALGQFAFYNCKGITDVYLYGNAPTIGNKAFPSGAVLHYIDGKTGWTSPTWNGYTVETFVPENEKIAVTGISLTPTSVKLACGDSVSLTATVSPSDATNKKVRYSSNDTNIATVGTDGVITAVGEGSTYVYANTVDGNYSASCYVTVTAPEEVKTPKLTVSSASAYAGNEVRVKVTLSDNPGVTTVKLNVGYDSSLLTLENVFDGGILGSAVHGDDLSANPYVLFWHNGAGTENFTANGTAVELVFRVNPDAEPCKTQVSLSVSPEGVVNSSNEVVTFSFKSGTVTVKNYIMGDIDGNGTAATPLDAQILARYIAGWKVVIANKAADLDGDGKITPRDSMILTRHIAGWKGYETLPVISAEQES